MMLRIAFNTEKSTIVGHDLGIHTVIQLKKLFLFKQMTQPDINLILWENYHKISDVNNCHRFLKLIAKH
jgi:hypothetical protein